MVRTAIAETLGAGVYEQLRADVLAGRFAPDERLRPVDLASRFGVGAGVVREALTRLAEQRLLVAEPNRGYRVMSIGAAQISELVELRRVTECGALRLSVQRGDLDWEARVLAAHQSLAELAEPADRDSLSLAHREFHQALVSGCGNGRLVALCEELFLESELYRRWAEVVVLGDGGEPHAHDRVGEHLALRNAALTRDADTLVALHEAHLTRTADLALAFASDRGATSGEA
jgi:DNA-binding GntR family transcriptional regulator